MRPVYDDDGNLIGYEDDGTDTSEDTSIFGDNDLEAGDPYGGKPWDITSSDNLNLSDYFNSLPKDIVGTGSFSDLVKGLTQAIGGKSSLGESGKLAGIMGLTALSNKLFGGGGGYAGYTGGIPTYTASRTMNTIPTTVANPLAGQTGQPATIPRRPGSGGITYFSPMTYTLVPPKPAGDGTTTKTTDTKATEEQVQAGASGGIMSLRNGHLGSYSDGGQLLRGPGDGVSDDIPATIADKQPARLANNEFVIPARIVSEIGNGSTEAGAKKLYDMMRRVQSRRAKTIGKDKVAVDSKAYKELDKL